MKRYYSLFHKPLVLAGLWLALLLFGQSSSISAQVGQPWAWGSNFSGGLGQGYFGGYAPSPVPNPYLKGAIQLVGNGLLLAVKSDGTVWTWRNNRDGGNISDGTNVNTNYPVQAAGLSNITQVAVGAPDSHDNGLSYQHALALKSDGTVWRWGDTLLIDTPDLTKTLPTQIPNLSSITQISGRTSAASRDYRPHYLALKSDGTVWAWGDNTYGQLGDGTTTNHAIPIQVPGLTSVIQVATGDTWSVALRNDGSVWVWGDNLHYLLGDGTETERHSPIAMKGLPGIVQITAGGAHTMALTADGNVWTWGTGINGNGDYEVHKTPVQVQGITNVVQLSAGGGHSLVMEACGHGG